MEVNLIDAESRTISYNDESDGEIVHTDLEPGDTVRMRSGSKLMTIADIDESGMTTAWWWCYESSRVFDAQVPVACLERASNKDAWGIA